MRLRELRIQRSLSQKDFARLINVAPNTLSQWERELRSPNPQTLRELADFFKVSIDYLLGYDTKKFLYPRTDDLDISPEEYELLLNIRKLDAKDRGYIEGQLSAFILSEKYKNADK